LCTNCSIIQTCTLYDVLRRSISTIRRHEDPDWFRCCYFGSWFILIKCTYRSRVTSIKVLIVFNDYFLYVHKNPFDLFEQIFG